MASIITQHNGYEYVAIAFATFSLTPQVWIGYRRRSLVDVSSLSMVAICVSSGLWGLYMNDSADILFACAAWFVGFHAIAILCMKVWLYYSRLNEHYKSFDKPTAPVTIACPSCPTCNSPPAESV